MKQLAQKYENLLESLRSLGSLLVAFSGGIDSAFLLHAAFEALGEQVVAATADSFSVPRRELQEAAAFAGKLGVEHVVMPTAEIANPDYAKNPANRCYFCKSELYSKLTALAVQRNIRNIANGTNLDDLGEYRPGLVAADEFRVLSPLKEAGLRKSEIRELARQLGLKLWDKPASPCLASRIPYGSSVTPEKLAAIEAAENILRDLGLRELRVRHFGARAVIETRPEDYPIITGQFDAIREKFSRFGFAAVEWRAFRSGALNRALTGAKAAD